MSHDAPRGDDTALNEEAAHAAERQSEHEQWLNGSFFGKRVVPLHWLHKKIDPAKYGPVRLVRPDDEDLVVGEEEWAEIFSILQEGDEVWHYAYHPRPKTGETGLAIVRDGTVLIAWKLIGF